MNIPINFPDLAATETLSLTTTTLVSTSKATARACFQLVRMTDLGEGYDKRPRWGEKFYISMELPGAKQTVQKKTIYIYLHVDSVKESYN